MVKGKIHFFVPALLVLVVTLISKVFAQTKAKTSQQMALLIKEKNSRTAIQKKIDSQLLQAMREKQGKKMAEGVELEPAIVGADDKGNLKVDISADVTDSLLDKIKKLGGVIIYPSKEYHTINALINFSAVEKIAGFKEVRFIAPAAVPQLNVPLKPGNKLNNPGINPPVNAPIQKQIIE